MAVKPKQLVVLGVDCGDLSKVEALVRAGRLPAFQSFFEAGVTAYGSFFGLSVTAGQRWACVGAGATLGSLGTSGSHRPAQNSAGRSGAETLWDAAARAGRKAIVFNFPGAMPADDGSPVAVLDALGRPLKSGPAPADGPAAMNAPAPADPPGNVPLAQAIDGLADTAVRLMAAREWDIFVMGSPGAIPPPAVEAAWAGAELWEAQDRLLARILGAAGKERLVFVVLTGSPPPAFPGFAPLEVLAGAGLATRRQDRPEAADEERSRALPLGASRINVNLQGREPRGVVAPEDYETVQRQILDALLTCKDPDSGLRPVAYALSRKDARILGLHGEAAADVVYALKTRAADATGPVDASPAPGAADSLIAVAGPGIRQGVRLGRFVRLIDVAPTACHALDLPVPRECEGAVIYQAFRNPNAGLKEILKLREAVERMETALFRESREPWDKHDCA